MRHPSCRAARVTKNRSTPKTVSFAFATKSPTKNPTPPPTVGSSHPEVNSEARATRVSRAGTGMAMTMHLHQEGKPLMEVLQELPQELPLMNQEQTYAQVVVGHRRPRSENFKPLTPCSKTL